MSKVSQNSTADLLKFVTRVALKILDNIISMKMQIAEGKFQKLPNVIFTLF